MTANEFLDSLTENGESLFKPQTDQIISVDMDRKISVPDTLRRIAVQGDHNVETTSIYIPRYWDGHDLSEMYIYINYMRADGTVGSYLCPEVMTRDKQLSMVPDGVDISKLSGLLDEYTILTSWTVSAHVTEIKGDLKFLICAKSTDDSGQLVQHWNTELCTDMYVSEGLEVEDTIIQNYPDIITDLLTKMATVQSLIPSVEMFDDLAYVYTGEGSEFEYDDADKLHQRLVAYTYSTEAINSKFDAIYEQIKSLHSAQSEEISSLGETLNSKISALSETHNSDMTKLDRALSNKFEDIYDRIESLEANVAEEFNTIGNAITQLDNNDATLNKNIEYTNEALDGRAKALEQLIASYHSS